jgi:Cellulase (glycosyl hydrolase family 5)
MTSSLRRISAALLALAATLALHTVPAHASPGMELAVQDDDVFLYGSLKARDRGLDAAKKLGVTRIRVNALWARLEVGNPRARKAPKHPVYNFGAIDQLQQEAALRKIKLQLTVAGPAPAWATKNHKVGNTWPSAYRYAQFVRAVAEHFKGRVDRYSIWNEPNWDTWLNPVSHAPGIYRDLYTHGYAAIKQADPSATVLIGELQPYAEKHSIAPLRFLRGVTCSTARYTAASRCKGLRADGLALHPYQFTVAPNRPFGGPDDAPFGSLRNMTQALNKLARRHALTTPTGNHLNLYLTEFGYLTKGIRALPASRRAAWLTQAYRIARRNPRVKEFLQYQLFDGPSRNPWHSGVMTSRGVPQAPFKALARVARR